ncbi:hypothetical protein [Marinobacter sp. X15-166B]|uniref:hypothetical protein n=1 Tax=Marinobacter sp. X15-166B TaxID=1897620 RepID=UPI00085BE764|nr:hypothetical protein [Marinobacter sp. X15-166B]OEY67831.1 hypothetical protein BG841_16300 [Marinobacter sp. X15-166B]
MYKYLGVALMIMTLTGCKDRVIWDSNGALESAAENREFWNTNGKMNSGDRHHWKNSKGENVIK